eukprot:359083-Chlamydomonas_euryale.AAC.2
MDLEGGFERWARKATGRFKRPTAGSKDEVGTRIQREASSRFKKRGWEADSKEGQQQFKRRGCEADSKGGQRQIQKDKVQKGEVGRRIQREAKSRFKKTGFKKSGFKKKGLGGGFKGRTQCSSARCI